MRLDLDCIPCLFKQAQDATSRITKNKRLQLEVLLKVADELPSISFREPPPLAGRRVHKIVQVITKNPDPYKKEKTRYTKLALRLYPQLKKKIENSKDPLLFSLKLAACGNLIDFGIGESFNFQKEFKEVLKKDFTILDYEKFKKELRKTDEILYLADNAGETVFDRLLIEQLKKRVIYAVRGKPIINDATAYDARKAGIDRIAKIISSGCDAPGTVLEFCSKDFLKTYQKSSFIISKGQGNFEALFGKRKHCFFLFRVKCSLVAKRLSCQIGDIILRGD